MSPDRDDAPGGSSPPPHRGQLAAEERNPTWAMTIQQECACGR